MRLGPKKSAAAAQVATPLPVRKQRQRRAPVAGCVDITPSELIQRLKEGKVYLPENAHRAADNFFKMGNLTALRELALRRTAERVDDQMVEYLWQNAIDGAWPSAERILVCIGADGAAQSVVRAASQCLSVCRFESGRAIQFSAPVCISNTLESWTFGWKSRWCRSALPHRAVANLQAT